MPEGSGVGGGEEPVEGGLHGDAVGPELFPVQVNVVIPGDAVAAGVHLDLSEEPGDGLQGPEELHAVQEGGHVVDPGGAVRKAQEQTEVRQGGGRVEFVEHGTSSHSKGGSLRKFWVVQMSSSSGWYCLAQSFTMTRPLAGRSPSIISRVRMSMTALYSPYMTWKWGGLCSLPKSTS